MKTKSSKNRKRLLISLIALSAIVLSSCNKNQKVVKTLDGKWNVVSLSVDGQNVPFESGDSMEFEFNACKLKKDETCTLIILATEDGETISNTTPYKVTDDGETLEQIFVLDGGVSATLSFDIKNLEKESVKLEGKGTATGLSYELEKK